MVLPVLDLEVFGATHGDGSNAFDHVSFKDVLSVVPDAALGALERSSIIEIKIIVLELRQIKRELKRINERADNSLLFTEVASFVITHVSLGTEALSALLRTDEWSLVIVNSHVDSEILFL